MKEALLNVVTDLKLMVLIVVLRASFQPRGENPANHLKERPQ